MKFPLIQRVASIFTALFTAVLIAIFACGCGSDTSDSTSTTTPPTSPPAISTTPASSQPASTSSLTLVASSQAASKGSQVCIPVTAKDFTAILSMQFTMKWDKDVLKFKEVKGFNLPDLTVANFGTQTAANQGFLTYSWFDQQLQGITKADGEKLYEVCFEVIGKPGSKSAFEFTGSPTVVEITNGAEQFLQLKPEAGSVEVK